jgi:hypothetical protein
MANQMKKVFPCLDIFLAAVLTEFSQHFCAAVQTVGFLTVVLMAHFRLALVNKGSLSNK